MLAADEEQTPPLHYIIIIHLTECFITFASLLLVHVLTITEDTTVTVVTSTREPGALIRTSAVYARVAQTLVGLTSSVAITFSVVVTATAGGVFVVAAVAVTSR